MLKIAPEDGENIHFVGTTLSLLMSFIYGAPCKARNVNLRLATLKAVSLYLLHNASTLNQYRKLSCGTVVCKQFASCQDTLITDGI
jgi:hypothetical protein